MALADNLQQLEREKMDRESVSYIFIYTTDAPLTDLLLINHTRVLV